MTDIDSMSGPELRRAVAEEVMGWVDTRVMVTHFWTAPDGVYRTECPRVEDWNPDTDWAAFGLVVEKLGELGLRKGRYGGDGWDAWEYERCDGEWANHATGETPMLAGCRAALKAVRAK